MNLFVADPHWGWWIVFYFFLGGIAAGAYFMAALIDLIGSEADRELSRVGYWIAFPLISVCGILLILDLERPERFWHMLFRSEVVLEAVGEGWPWSGHSWQVMTRAPLVKYWSPMSIGSWALLLFGFCSALSFLGSLWPDGWLARWLRRGVWGRAFQVFGALVGFFVAAYTGALLTATNQPVWSDSVWIAPLFLTSAASTGSATMILLARCGGIGSLQALHRLARADLWALGLELVVFVVFLGSLGLMLQPVWQTWPGKLLLAGTLVLGLLVPLALHLRTGLLGRHGLMVAAAFALLGGFALRYAILATPPELLARGPAIISDFHRENGLATDGEKGFSAFTGFSPEDGRAPGDPGADPGNRPVRLQPRSKVFHDE